MKILNTPIAHKMIRSAIRKIRANKIKTPSYGMMRNIIYKNTRRGKWQVEYIGRYCKSPYIAAYFFKGDTHLAKKADYYLIKEFYP